MPTLLVHFQYMLIQEGLYLSAMLVHSIDGTGLSYLWNSAACERVAGLGLDPFTCGVEVLPSHKLVGCVGGKEGTVWSSGLELVGVASVTIIHVTQRFLAKWKLDIETISK